MPEGGMLAKKGWWSEEECVVGRKGSQRGRRRLAPPHLCRHSPPSAACFPAKLGVGARFTLPLSTWLMPGPTPRTSPRCVARPTLDSASTPPHLPFALVSKYHRSPWCCMALPNLRRIFSSSRTPLEERALSRKAFFRFIAFLASCAAIALVSSGINRRDHRIAAATQAAFRAGSRRRF